MSSDISSSLGGAPDLPPPPPPPSFTSSTAKRITIDPLKARINALQKTLLEKTVYDLTKDHQLRQRVPTEYSDILPLDNWKNIWALGDFRATLTHEQAKDLKLITKALKTTKAEFNEMCEEAAQRVKNLGKEDTAAREEVNHFIDQIEAKLPAIDQIVSDLRKRIDLIREKKIRPAADQQEDANHPASGKRWYVEVKRLYTAENQDLIEEFKGYREAVKKAEANAKSTGIEIPAKRRQKMMMHLQKLERQSSFTGWLRNAYDSLEEIFDPEKARIIEEAALTLGGRYPVAGNDNTMMIVDSFDQNLKDFEKKMLKEHERL